MAVLLGSDAKESRNFKNPTTRFRRKNGPQCRCGPFSIWSWRYLWHLTSSHYRVFYSAAAVRVWGADLVGRVRTLRPLAVVVCRRSTYNTEYAWVDRLNVVSIYVSLRGNEIVDCLLSYRHKGSLSYLPYQAIKREDRLVPSICVD